MSNRRDRIPIWARPEPGSRKPRFTREQIAAAALAIADTEGFEAVSMRRVAAELGAGTMTLYHYIRTKDDLLALMDDALLSEVLIPDGELPADWRAALTAILRRTRALFVKHPWALLSMLDAPPGPNGMHHFEQTLAALANTPLDTAGKLELLGIADDFVFGHALRAGAVRKIGPPDAETLKAITEFSQAQLRTGRFPHTQAMFNDVNPQDGFEQMAGSSTDEQRFELGLRTLLDGFALRMGLATQEG
jgi:AcrR family transcriptional regulator